jgi:hypothetical protein
MYNQKSCTFAYISSSLYNNDKSQDIAKGSSSQLSILAATLKDISEFSRLCDFDTLL